MNRQALLITGMALGATIMFLLDPDRGRRRRALIRDQLAHGTNELNDLRSGIGSRARHIRNRTRGLVHETRARISPDEVDDTVLEARVRSHLGRLIADPSNIDVTAEHGRITLRGLAREDEVDGLVDGIQGIQGVHDVINRLTAPENA